MTAQVKPTMRESRRLQTRDRTDDIATRDAMLTKLVASALRGLEAR